MRITIVQPDIIWEDISANLFHLENLIAFSKGFTDLIVLPEMFTTGFSMNAKSFAEEPGSTTYLWMKKLSAEKNAAVCGSYIVCEEGACYNRFVFVSPSGDHYSYNKRHLFSISGEDQNYIRGGERLVFSYSGFRIMPVICYDLRFPVWIRNRGDYDLMICVANWPGSRRDVWTTLLRARAIENQCFVAGINRIGKDKEGISYLGDSLLLDARGMALLELNEQSEGHATADLSLQLLNKFRQEFPAWKDADDFTLNI
jgi:predicted amidohydrolase